MFKKLITICLFLLMMVGTSIAQSSGLGLGLILGEPTGISMKYWTGRTTAIDGAVAWSIGKYSGTHLHGDYLWHIFNLINIRRGKLPFYYGVGARLGLGGKENRVGIRGVAGLAYLLADLPLDVFLEIAPVFDLSPKTDLDLNAAIGIRYFF